MLKWKIKTVEPSVEFEKGRTPASYYNEVEVEADGVDIVKEGEVVVFFNVVKGYDEARIPVNKRTVRAIYSIRNIISITMEESDEQTSETTV